LSAAFVAAVGELLHFIVETYVFGDATTMFGRRAPIGADGALGAGSDRLKFSYQASW
jgi:hypothetical protein